MLWLVIQEPKRQYREAYAIVVKVVEAKSAIAASRMFASDPDCAERCEREFKRPYARPITENAVYML